MQRLTLLPWMQGYVCWKQLCTSTQRHLAEGAVKFLPWLLCHTCRPQCDGCGPGLCVVVGEAVVCNYKMSTGWAVMCSTFMQP